MAMRKELRDEWVRRLRSGRYTPGTLAMRNLPSTPPATVANDINRGLVSVDTLLSDNDTFCCLGVLCEIGVEWGELARVGVLDNHVLYGMANDVDAYRVSAYPPPGWGGLLSGVDQLLAKRNDGIVPGREHDPNANERWSFDRIADWIEENVPVDEA